MALLGTSQIEFQADKSIVKTTATVVRDKVTLPLPAVSFQKPLDLAKTKLADPNFNQSSEIDMFFGAQLYDSLRRGKIFEHAGLHLVETVFGYVATGVKTNDSHHPSLITSWIKTSTCRSFGKLKKLSCLSKSCLQVKNWLSPSTTMTQRSETLKVDSLSQCHLWKRHQVAATFQHALKRFESQEWRLMTNPILHKQYKAFIDKFVSLGHLKPVPEEQIDNGCCNHFYFTHHAVMKEPSKTSKQSGFRWLSKNHNRHFTQRHLDGGSDFTTTHFWFTRQISTNTVGLTADTRRSIDRLTYHLLRSHFMTSPGAMIQARTSNIHRWRDWPMV